LVRSIEPNDLYIHYLNTYSIWVPEADYQVVVLKPREANSDFRIPVASLRQRLLGGARRLVGVLTRNER
jgi:hypothetical protein